MRINLIAVGTRMPDWVNQGFADYAKRLPRDFQLNLIEINAPKRHKGANLERVMQQEATQLLSTIPQGNHVIAMDSRGQSFPTEELSTKLLRFYESSQDISLLVGGPEGLAPACLERANEKWSLSRLTLPHPVVRIVIAEQIYRAWSILQKHPYHR